MRRCIAIALLGLLFQISVGQISVGAQDQADDSVRRVTQQVAPAYPDLARKLNLQGTVRLRVTVAQDGAARTAEVLGGNPVLVKAAQDAVMRWKWAPAAGETKEVIELRFHPR